MNGTTEHPIFYWHDGYGDRFRVDVGDFDEAAECPHCVPVYSAETVDRLRARVAELEAAKGEPVAYLHQVVCGDGEPDQALSFAPDNFPLAGILGYRSLSHEPLFRAPLNNELERLRTELGRAYRALHGFAFAYREGKMLNDAAVMYHAPTIGAASRFAREGALDGAEYFIGKPVDVLHTALRVDDVDAG